MKQLPPSDYRSGLVPQGGPQDGPLPGPYNPGYNSGYNGGGTARSEPPSGGLLEYWRILQRHAGAIVLITFLGVLVALVFTLPQTPVYQAHAIIEIQAMNEDFMHMRDVNPTADATASYYPEFDIQTQVRILQSGALLERVIKKLDLDHKPLIANETRLSSWRNALGLKPAIKADQFGDALRMTAGNLKIQAQPNTRLIEVFCDSTYPQMAADFANTLTSEFIEENLESRWQTTQHTGEWLTRQMEDLKIKLEKSEEALEAYSRQSGLMFTQEKDNAADLKLKQLQEELSKAQADRIQKQSHYELASSAKTDSLGEVLDDGSLKDIQGKLTDLRRQQAELAAAYTASHPKMKRVQAQIAELESSLRRESGNIQRRIENDFRTAQRREKLLAADYGAQARLMTEQADKVAHYNILKREVDTTRQLYDSMFQRVKESSIASALRASNIRVVDPATPPGGPYKPSLVTNAGVGLITGLFFGILFVLFRERVDRTIQEPGDAALYLGLPELGIVPNSAVDPMRKRPLLPLSSGAYTGGELSLAAATDRTSPLTEAFHATLTSLMFLGENGERPRVIIVSSAAPKEGKTTLTTNLAIAMACTHERVLLIDADLRRPHLHRIFDIDNGKGLIDLLRRTEPIQAPLNGHVSKTAVANLSVMPSGRAHDGETTLLHSVRLAELIELVRGEYDTVLIDTPPMLTMADARIIARHADGVVMVARAHQTSRDSLRDACRRFEIDGTRVLGTVLNDWNPRKSSRYGYYRYYDRYKHYYGKPSGE